MSVQQETLQVASLAALSLVGLLAFKGRTARVGHRPMLFETAQEGSLRGTLRKISPLLVPEEVIVLHDEFLVVSDEVVRVRRVAIDIVAGVAPILFR
eukprot:scaffold5657_cov270-Pinguiococcus_pyrenoidosus.AAC.5